VFTTSDLVIVRSNAFRYLAKERDDQFDPDANYFMLLGGGKVRFARLGRTSGIFSQQDYKYPLARSDIYAGECKDFFFGVLPDCIDFRAWYSRECSIVPPEDQEIYAPTEAERAALEELLEVEK